MTSDKEIRHEMRERAVEYQRKLEAETCGGVFDYISRDVPYVHGQAPFVFYDESATFPQWQGPAIDTVRCERCKVYHQAGGPHECVAQIEAPK